MKVAQSDQETKNSQEPVSLQRTGTFNEAIEFNSAATTGQSLETASVKNELSISKEVKTTDVEAQPSLDVDRILNARDQEAPKTTEKVPSKAFVPQAPEIADRKKEQ